MVDTGYVTPTGRIVVRGDPPVKIEKNIGTVANCYPGRLVVKEATDFDVKVADGISPPIGFLSFEHSSENDRPATMDTIYELDDNAVVVKGGGFAIRGKLAAGFAAVMGDKLFSWTNGRVVPGAMINGCPAIKVPFVKKTSAYDTGIDIPGGVIIKDVLAYVSTHDSSGTIDVGFINAGESGDEDGLLVGESLAAVGFRTHELVNVSGSAITVGADLLESKLTDAAAVVYGAMKDPGYVTNGTITSLAYKTSSHTVAGDLYIVIMSPGIIEVGKAGQSLASSTSDQDIIIEAVI